MNRPTRPPVESWGGKTIKPGESRNVELAVGESYSGMTLRIPLHVRRGIDSGPSVFVTAALHGDEINGAGAVRTLIQDERLQLKRGTLVLVPVLNILGFDRHTRYLPDRRDLNRCFPGSKSGSLARRMARVLFDEIVRRCDFGIDLHTAAIRRTNFPNIRADIDQPEVRRMALASGCEVIVAGKGPKGALRREACAAGCPTIAFEGGEVWKVESTIVGYAVRAVKNVLRDLDMLAGSPKQPPYQIVVRRTKWIRADRGGFLQFHVSPGETVAKGQALATNTSLLGRERNVLQSPFAGLVLGMTTMPAISPGEPVCHLAELSDDLEDIQQIRERLSAQSLHERLIGDLATNLMLVEPSDESP